MNPIQIAKMMKQAQKMQADAQRLQAELAAKTFEASAAGGAVKAVANGAGDLQSLAISPDLIKDAAGDPDMLQDLILTAVREAVGKGRAEVQKEMSKLTAGLGIPGL
jgi:nucleoid-associated protein EbfC